MAEAGGGEKAPQTEAPLRANAAALRMAARTGDVERVAQLLGAGLTAAHMRSDGNLALQWAAERGHAEVAALLLPLLTAADMSADGAEALRLAARNGHTKVVALLLPRLPPAAVTAAVDSEALLEAAEAATREAHLEIVALFLSRLAADGVAPRHERRIIHALFTVIRSGRAGVELLLSHLSPDDVRRYARECALVCAIRQHNSEVVALLLSRMTLEDVRAYDNSALQTAASSGHSEGVAQLIAAGLTLDDVRAHGYCALRSAADFGHSEVVAQLIAAGLTLDDLRVQNNEPLRATWEGEGRRAAITVALHVAGLAEVHGGDDAESARVAVRHAATKGHKKTAELLFAAGLTRADAEQAGPAARVHFEEWSNRRAALALMLACRRRHGQGERRLWLPPETLEMALKPLA